MKKIFSTLFLALALVACAKNPSQPAVPTAIVQAPATVMPKATALPTVEAIAIPATAVPTATLPAATATSAGLTWLHDPTNLPAGSYAGIIGDGPFDHDQSDGLPRMVELHVLSANQIFLIFGDHGNIPSIGDVGGPTGCYLVVGRGRIIWTTQPTAGEFGLISWPVRSKFEVYNVDPSADVFAWAAAKMEALQKDPGYPLTCAKGVDLWVKNP